MNASTTVSILFRLIKDTFRQSMASVPVLATAGRWALSRRMEEYGSHPRTGSASSIRVTFSLTNSRRRYISRKSLPTASPATRSQQRTSPRWFEMSGSTTPPSASSPRKRSVSATNSKARTPTGKKSSTSARRSIPTFAPPLPLPRPRLQQQRRMERNGDSLDFSIDPCLLSDHVVLRLVRGRVSVVTLGGVPVRLLQTAARIQHAARRTRRRAPRIARELHDTLLQSFQGLMHAVAGGELIGSPDAPRTRGRLLMSWFHDAARAITEDRDAVQGMRSSAVTENDLAKAIEGVGQELAAHQGDANGAAPAFSLAIRN